MNFNLNRINPNQTQVIYMDGRFETLTNEELNELIGTDEWYQVEGPQLPQ